jgi:hypothetical protein
VCTRLPHPSRPGSRQAADGDEGVSYPGQAGPRALPLLAAAGETVRRALVKLSSVASKLNTLPPQDMIRAMIAGARDPHTLAVLPGSYL